MIIDQELEANFLKLRNKLKERFGKKPDLNGILFIIGMQELGQLREEFTKDEKQDLMHIATCTILENDGYFKNIGRDSEGWPIFEKLKDLPQHIQLKEQEQYLKKKTIAYFKNINYI